MAKVEILKTKCLVYSSVRENKNKYYICSIEKEGEKYRAVFKYGRLGRSPRTFPKPYTSLQNAENQYFDKISEQKDEGYKEVDIETIMQSDGSYYYQ